MDSTIATSAGLWPWMAENAGGWDTSDRGSVPPLPTGDAPPWALLDKESEWSHARHLEILLDRIGPRHPDAENLTIDETKGIVHVAESAMIEPSVHLIGPCYIGPEATLRHGAYVREHSWICWKALLGHASEMKHSVLLPRAKAPHFNYVGDSIIGSDANLGAGVIMSNLRNDGSEVFLRKENVRIGSGLRKFGGLIGDDVQIGCNSVVNPGTILGVSCNVYPTTSILGVHPGSTILR